MTDLEPTQQPNDPANPEAPLPRRRLRDPGAPDARQDMTTPLAGIVAIVAVLMMTCTPILTATAAVASQQSPGAEAIRPGPVALIGALVFFGIALLGLVGGLGAIFRKNWGRLMLLAHAGLVLVYLWGMVGYRLHLGIEGMTETAPTRSALILFFTFSGAIFLAVSGLMLFTLRHFTRPQVKAQFH